MRCTSWRESMIIKTLVAAAAFSLAAVSSAAAIDATVGKPVPVGTVFPNCKGKYPSAASKFSVPFGKGKVDLGGETGRTFTAKGGPCKGKRLKVRTVVYTPTQKAKGQTVTITLKGRNRGKTISVTVRN